MNNAYQYQKGHRIGARSMYKFWKYYYDGAEADYEKEFGSAFPKQIVKKLKPGDAVYVDLDKNGVIDANDMSRDNGYTDDPQYIAGLQFGFQWKRTVDERTVHWSMERHPPHLRCVPSAVLPFVVKQRRWSAAVSCRQYLDSRQSVAEC